MDDMILYIMKAYGKNGNQVTIGETYLKACIYFRNGCF